MVRVLAAEGLVGTAVDPAHRRRNTVELTPRGADLERRAGAVLDVALDDLLRLAGVDGPVLLAQAARLRDALLAAGWRPGGAGAGS